jgi:hypothetical protein
MYAELTKFVVAECPAPFEPNPEPRHGRRHQSLPSSQQLLAYGYQ